jgi:hypothetical protein
MLALATTAAICIVKAGKKAEPLWRGDVLAQWPAEVLALAFSPDGRFVAVASAEGWARIGVDDGRVEPVGREAAQALRFTPDGAHLLVGRRDGTVTLWRADTWSERGRVAGYPGAVTAIAVSDDGRWAAIRTREPERPDSAVVHVVALPDLTPAWSWEGGADSIVFRPRTRQLTVCHSRHSGVYLHDLTAGAEDGFVFGNDDRHIEELAYNRPGSLLVAASFQAGTVRAVEVLAHSGRTSPLGQRVAGCFGGTGRFAVNAAGTDVAVEEFAGADDTVPGQIRLGSLRRFGLASHALPRENPTRSTDFGFIGDEPWLRFGDGTIDHFAGYDGRNVEPVARHTTCVAVVAGGADGLVFAGQGGAISRYEPTGVATLLERHRADWTHLATLTATELAGIDADGGLWLIHGLAAHPAPGIVAGVGDILAVGGGAAACLTADGDVALWRPTSGRLAPVPMPAGMPGHTPTAAAFSPDGSHLAVGRGPILAVYNDGALAGSASTGGRIRGLAWTIDSHGILVGIERRGIELWPHAVITH